MFLCEGTAALRVPERVTIHLDLSPNPKGSSFHLSTRCCVITDLHNVSFIWFVLNCENVMLLFLGHGCAALLLVWNRRYMLSSQMTKEGGPGSSCTSKYTFYCGWSRRLSKRNREPEPEVAICVSVYNGSFFFKQIHLLCCCLTQVGRVIAHRTDDSDSSYALSAPVSPPPVMPPPHTGVYSIHAKQHHQVTKLIQQDKISATLTDQIEWWLKTYSFIV